MATDDSDLWAPEAKSSWPSEIAKQLSSKARTGFDQELEAYASSDMPPAKKSDPLPKLGDEYRACARFLNRLAAETPLIHFVDAKCNSEGFSYSDLRRVSWRQSDEPGCGPMLVLRFLEAETTEVRLEGRRLDDIRHYISEKTLPWVWEKPHNVIMPAANVAVITRLTISRMER